ncbi:hypothetical protein UPYG_G00235070 [Umbra pygmaea]|uniref:Uncharacterized protein n=1 Tax=Umbra pygmaea TaxID=75934 RepID=A0ABD0WJ01_UMBPY
MKKILISTKFAASVFLYIYVSSHYGTLKYNYKHTISVSLLLTIALSLCKESIFSVLTLLFQDLCNPSFHAVNLLLCHILTDGSPFLHDQCFECQNLWVLVCPSAS